LITTPPPSEDQVTLPTDDLPDLTDPNMVPPFDSSMITPPGDIFVPIEDLPDTPVDNQGDGPGIVPDTQDTQSFPPTILPDPDRPQTGDDNNPVIWVSTMIASALVLRFLLSNKSRLLGR